MSAPVLDAHHPRCSACARSVSEVDPETGLCLRCIAESGAWELGMVRVSLHGEEPTTLLDFILANEETLTLEVVELLASANPGDEIPFDCGGGSDALRIISRGEP